MCQNLSSGAILDGSKEIGDPIKLLTSDVDTWCRLVEEIGQNWSYLISTVSYPHSSKFWFWPITTTNQHHVSEFELMSNIGSKEIGVSEIFSSRVHTCLLVFFAMFDCVSPLIRSSPITKTMISGSGRDYWIFHCVLNVTPFLVCHVWSCVTSYQKFSYHQNND